MKQITPAEIVDEMKRSYLDYAMSVIVSRALPDARDGLKPVHRRILYAMHKMGLSASSRFSKSAKVVGEVLGKYHPHGDSSVYEALARMAQDFSMRYPLIKGQGNFGSIDGDPPAAMRYTEVKLAKIAEEILVDIEKDTVSFIPNFDGSLEEPVYLPAKLPNLLLMGAEGIAVGMATKIPPHNLSEIIQGLILMIKNARLVNGKEKKLNPEEFSQNLTFDISTDQLLTVIKGPDFPTGGIIYGFQDIQKAYSTGRGSILIRGQVDHEELKNGREAIVIKEIPYQVNKATLVEKIAQLVNDKKIIGIAELRDESDREGIRIVIELKRDASYKKILNNLYKYTELQTNFPLNMVALVDGVPQTLSLKSVLEVYIKHRVDIVVKRSQFELIEAKNRAHILEGYLIALDNIDDVIETIKKAANEPEAKINLQKKFNLTEIQAQAILDMQLKRLTGLERTKIEDELSLLKETIAYLEGLLTDVFRILKVIENELLYLEKKYGDQRKTKIINQKPGEITDEQLIENKEVIVVITKEGYIKSVPRETFRVQNRGGKGVAGIETKETDNVYFITTTMTHDYILFFTNKGRVFQNRVWEIPAGSRRSKGKAVVNLINTQSDEKVTSILTFSNDQSINNKDRFILMFTKKGIVKKSPFKDYTQIRSNGIIAIRLTNNDELLWVKITDGHDNAIMISKSGKAIVFPEKEVRIVGRASIGVKGMTLDQNDEVVAADTFSNDEFKKDLLVISQKGIGKKTLLSNFRGQHRGGKGVKVSTIDKKTGYLAFAEIVDEDHKTIIITSLKGQVVKIPLNSIPQRSRTAKGVILMRFSQKDDYIASATFI